MKLRHITALTHVGWYLMVPRELNEPRRYDLDAQLNKWEIVGTFDRRLIVRQPSATSFRCQTDWKGARLRV